MTNLNVRYNHFEHDGEDTPSLIIDGLRLRGDECSHFYAWLKDQGMSRRADLVLIGLTRAIDGQQGKIGGNTRVSLTDAAHQDTARKIADRYDEDIEIV